MLVGIEGYETEAVIKGRKCSLEELRLKDTLSPSFAGCGVLRKSYALKMCKPIL